MGSPTGTPQLTATQKHELQRRITEASAALDAAATTRDPDHEILPPDLSWEQYASIVR